MFRVKVVSDITCFPGKDGMVPTNVAILTGKPFRPSLFVDDASRNDVLAASAFCAQTLAGRVSGVTICSTLSSVRGVTDVGERKESREGGGGY